MDLDKRERISFARDNDAVSAQVQGGKVRVMMTVRVKLVSVHFGIPHNFL